MEENKDLQPSSEDVSVSKSNAPFFSKQDVDALIKRLKEKQYNGRVERNNLILDLIRAKQPISKYEVAKISEMGYNTIKQITKEFEFCGLIVIENAIGENGMPVRLISIKKEEAENG